jgi:hypothetical protein
VAFVSQYKGKLNLNTDRNKSTSFLLSLCHANRAISQNINRIQRQEIFLKACRLFGHVGPDTFCNNVWNACFFLFNNSNINDSKDESTKLLLVLCWVIEVGEITNVLSGCLSTSLTDVLQNQKYNKLFVDMICLLELLHK